MQGDALLPCPQPVAVGGAGRGANEREGRSIGSCAPRHSSGAAQMLLMHCALRCAPLTHVQVGVKAVDPDVLQQALAADIITFGSPSAIK